MKMIIGGAYQGQIEWAQEQYKDINWIDGEACEYSELFTCQGILNFHTYIKRLLGEEWDETESKLQTLAEQLIAKNPDIIIVSNEVGYGLVPIEAFDRQYREQTGRICTALAAVSEEVVRVVMGIGTRIK